MGDGVCEAVQLDVGDTLRVGVTLGVGVSDAIGVKDCDPVCVREGVVEGDED